MVNAEFYMEAESEARADVEFDVGAKQDQQMGQTMGVIKVTWPPKAHPIPKSDELGSGYRKSMPKIHRFKKDFIVYSCPAIRKVVQHVIVNIGRGKAVQQVGKSIFTRLTAP